MESAVKFITVHEIGINKYLTEMYEKGFELVDVSKFFRGHNMGCYNGSLREDLLILSLNKVDKPRYCTYSLFITRRLEDTEIKINTSINEKNADGFEIFRLVTDNQLSIQNSITSDVRTISVFYKKASC